MRRTSIHHRQRGRRRAPNRRIHIRACAQRNPRRANGHIMGTGRHRKLERGDLGRTCERLFAVEDRMRSVGGCGRAIEDLSVPEGRPTAGGYTPG